MARRGFSQERFKVFYFLALLAGVLVTLMIGANGGLSAYYGIYKASVIIHVIGLAALSLTLLLRRENPLAHFKKGFLWFIYLGGVIGVFTTLFLNFAFGKISISAIMALGLLGQSIMGLLIDQFGLFGMPRYPFHPRKLIGIIIVSAGIFVMIDSFVLIPVLISFAAGICVVLSRTLNARLSEASSVYTSTFYNYVTGLSVSIIALFVLAQADLASGFSFVANPWIYLGGLLGAAVVFIGNVTVPKVSAFYLTLLMFSGQVFSGVIFDQIVATEFAALILVGGILVVAGLCIDLVIDRRHRNKLANSS